MHTLARKYIKTAIEFLMIGLSIGGWMMVRRELYGQLPLPYQTSAHTHALFVTRRTISWSRWLKGGTTSSAIRMQRRA